MNSRSPIRPFVERCLVLLAFGFGPADRAAAQVQYRMVALSGQAAPGTAAGISYSGFGSPVLNDISQAAYFALLAGRGVTSDVALYAGSLAAPQLVARAGDAAPDTPAGVNYGTFPGSPVLNDAGQVAYFVTLDGSGVTLANSGAIYAGPLAAPQLVAREGDAAPWTPAGVNYSSLDAYPPVLNEEGQTAYLAVLTGSGVTTANDGAIYAGPPAAPQLVAREGNAAPGTSAGVSYQFLGVPVLNDAGQAAYFAALTGSGVTAANSRAIYAGPLTAPQLVAREGDAAPGTPAGVNYLFLSAPALNDAGQVAYYASLTGSGVTAVNDQAIYAGSLAAPQLVARTGGAAAGMPAGVTYGFLSNVLNLNDAGHVAYRTFMFGGGVTPANDEAIYVGPPAAPQLLAREGDAAPGTPPGVTYSTISTPALNNAGQAAFVAFFRGSGVTSANGRGLFASDPTLGTMLIARTGDLFDVGGGDFRTIEGLGINFLLGRSDDEPTGLSNDGTLVFHLEFTDDTSGIFTARIVPEPGALPLLSAAGLTLVGCRSVRGRLLV